MTKADKAPIKITEKIIGQEIVKPPEPPIAPYERPAKLRGTTYKIKPPTLNAALYITINDQRLDDGALRPFEIFLNTKDVTHSQWMIAVTRLLSGHFRQRQDFAWVIDELKQVFDPKGSYFLPGGGGLCGGIVAHIATVIEEHCRELGLFKPIPLTAEQQQTLAAKKAEATARGVTGKECGKCHEPALYFLDGCWTCTSCGDSKCG